MAVVVKSKRVIVKNSTKNAIIYFADGSVCTLQSGLMECFTGTFWHRLATVQTLANIDGQIIDLEIIAFRGVLLSTRFK
jgi:hypothetical protein